MYHYSDTLTQFKRQKEAKMEKIKELRSQIEKLKNEIANLGDMRPGSLTRQRRKWGKEYWQISYTHRGRGRTGYVSDARHEEALRQTEAYKRFKGICLELVDLSVELAKLTDKESVT